MKTVKRSRMLPMVGMMLALLTWLANSSNPSNGRTGAPFDGNCNNCHTGGSFNGTVEVDGMPATVQPNTVYPLTITLTPTVGSPIRGGYQLVAVDANNANCGDLAAGNAQSGTDMAGNREYLEHRGAKAFTGGGPATWNFNWTSPANVPGNTVKFYFIGNFCNGNSNGSGDNALAFLQTYPFSGPPPLAASINDTDNVTCFGGSNGTASVSVSGGTAPYTYLWSNGQTTATATNLVAGNYIVTVTGAQSSGTTTASTTITQPTQLNASATADGALSCANPDVAVTVTANGGTPGLNYAWSNGDTGNPLVVSTAGTYTVTVTDNNNCTKTASTTVTGTVSPPTVTIVPPGTISCLTPTVILNGSGSSGGPQFVYAWSTTNGNIVSGGTTLMPLVNAAGTYTLLVTNTSNGCTASASTTVTDNTVVPNSSAVGGTLTCLATSLTLNGGSTTNNVTYAWSGPSGFTSTLEDPVVNLSGLYILTVTNMVNGCTSTATTAVNTDQISPTAGTAVPPNLNCTVAQLQLDGSTSSQGPAFVYSWTTTDGNIVSGANTLTPTVNEAGTYVLLVTNINNGCIQTASATVQQSPAVSLVLQNSSNVGCFGQNNGSASVLGGGGQGSLDYLWNTGDTMPTVSGLVAGTYTVTTTDAEGCTAGLAVTITQPDAFQVNAMATGETSQGGNDGTAFAAPTGGTQPFVYAWSNGAATAMIDSLPPGAYTVSVADNNGCAAVQTVNVNAFNCALTSTISATQVTCHGAANGTVTVNPTGGSQPLVILWSNGATTPGISNLAPGTYTASITDATNCSFVISTQISEPAILSANAVSTNETSLNANDGTASALPTGGTQPYSFAWNNGETTPQLDSLTPGVYTVSVTDNNGCATVQTVNISAFNCALEFTSSVQPVSCFGGSDGQATVLLDGGVLPYAYLWINGATTSTVSNLMAGSYAVTMSDAFGCFEVTTAVVTEPAALTSSVDSVQNDVNNSQTGNISVTVAGGSSGYTYVWTQNGLNYATTEDLSGLGAGTYQLTATDTRGCTVVLGPVVVDNTVSSKEPGKEATHLLLWPNPASDIINVSWNSAVQPVFARMADVRGQWAMELTADQLVQPILVQQLPAGLYILQVLFANGSVSTVCWLKSE